MRAALEPSLVDAPGGVERHQAGGLHLGRGVGDPRLHGLGVAQQAVLDGPVERALAHRVVGAARHAEPAHAVVDPAGHEPLLGDQEAVTFIAEQGIGAEADVLVEDLRVTAEDTESRLRVLHRGHVAHDRHPGSVDRDDEHRGAPMWRRVRIRDGHDDEEVGDRPVRGEPLVPVEDVAVAVAHGARRELRRIRAGRGRLGHRERGPELAGEQWIEPALLLLGACRRARGSRCCRSPAPGSRRRAARRSTCRGSRSSGRASPGRSPARRGTAAGGRPTAPALLTASCSGALMRSSSTCVRRSSTASIGQTSSRTNARIHSSLRSNSGSVEKSQAIRFLSRAQRRAVSHTEVKSSKYSLLALSEMARRLVP